MMLEVSACAKSLECHVRSSDPLQQVSVLCKIAASNAVITISRDMGLLTTRCTKHDHRPNMPERMGDVLLLQKPEVN